MSRHSFLPMAPERTLIQKLYNRAAKFHSKQRHSNSSSEEFRTDFMIAMEDDLTIQNIGGLTIQNICEMLQTIHAKQSNTTSVNAKRYTKHKPTQQFL